MSFCRLLPNNFKVAVIKFIQKKDKSLTHPIHYHPISPLEVPGKIFKRIILARLNTFLTKNAVKKITWF